MFGGLQVVTATRLAESGVLPLDPGRAAILLAAANSTGGVMGKMIDAQSIVVAGAATGQTGQEGRGAALRLRPQRRAGGAGRAGRPVAGLRLDGGGAQGVRPRTFRTQATTRRSSTGIQAN